MKIALHFSPLGSANGCPTGTGQHILFMAQALSSLSPVERLDIVASRFAYRLHGPAFPPALIRLPVHLYSLPEGWMRRLQLLTDLIPLDRWADGADWIYCPKEQPVATKRCRLAVMVHDVAASEAYIPGMPSSRVRAPRGWPMSMKRIIERSHLIATASAFTASRFRELWGIGDDRRLCVIGNGVSPIYRPDSLPGDADVLPRHRLTPGAFLLSVGSLTWRKGGDTLLELAKELAQRRSELRIVVSGQRHDVELFERYNQMKCEDPNLPIELLGYVPDNDLAALYRGAHAFVFPSRYEGFGIPVLEAMACGTPVICSDSAALPEVAGDAAILVKAGSASAILDAVRSLDRDSSCRGAQIEKGIARAGEFTWERAARRLVDAMRAVDAAS